MFIGEKRILSKKTAPYTPGTQVRPIDIHGQVRRDVAGASLGAGLRRQGCLLPQRSPYGNDVYSNVFVLFA